MSIARIEMCLCAHPVNDWRNCATSELDKRTFNAEGTDLIKVVAVYVRIYTEQSAHDGAHRFFERSGKRHACGLS